MMPIPRALLIHTVQWSPRVDTGEWSEAIYGETKSIRYTRIEPSNRVIIGKDNIQRQLYATLFYDTVNSSPKGINISLQDKITFRGQEYIVLTIEPIYDTGSEPHHYEIGLG